MAFWWGLALAAGGGAPAPWTVEKLAEGFRFTEGPAWTRDGGWLFSDIPADTIFAVKPGGEAAVWRRPSRQANGNTFDREGRLISCEHGSRRVTRTSSDGTLEILAERYQGKRLNSPNDATVADDGTLYFTDPPYGVREADRELDFSGVYAVRPGGESVLLHDGLPRPNGIVLSPDQRTLYVSDSQEGRVYAFPRAADGKLGERREFADLRGTEPGVPDGIRVDRAGNVYSGGSGGLYVIDPAGKTLRKIPFPAPVTNVAFGEDGRWLFVTAGPAVYRVRTEESGVWRDGPLPRGEIR